jgi:CRP/FNR family cyclic AMP-dependent transcriptional regulator
MLRFQRDPLTTTLRSLGFSESAARRLARAGTPIDVDGGVALTTKGERGEEAFLIVEGEVIVDLGDRTVTVGPGQVIGEIAALDPFARRNATVRTSGRTLVLVYDVQTFRSLAATDLQPLLVPERTAA